MQALRQLHDVDFKLLRCFCTIVDEGGFAAAQTALNLSQSMLSEYLKTLEIRIGARLCQRGPKGFKLYREGEIVYKAAKALFASVDAFKQQTAGLNGGLGFELSVAVQDGIIDHPASCVPEAISRFSEYYPNLTLKLEIAHGFRVMERVIDGTVHVGVGLSVNQDLSELRSELLYEEEDFLYCGRGHPLFDLAENSIDQACLEDCAYCHRGPFECFLPNGTQGFSQNGDIGHGAEAQLALVLCGRNVAFLPEHLATPFVKAGRMRLLRPDITRRISPVVAVMRPDQGHNPLARRFIECLIDCHAEAEALGLRPKQQRQGASPPGWPAGARAQNVSPLVPAGNRAMQSISIAPPESSAATPTQVRAGSRSAGKNRR